MGSKKLREKVFLVEGLRAKEDGLRSERNGNLGLTQWRYGTRVIYLDLDACCFRELIRILEVEIWKLI